MGEEYIGEGNVRRGGRALIFSIVKALLCHTTLDIQRVSTVDLLNNYAHFVRVSNPAKLADSEYTIPTIPLALLVWFAEPNEGTVVTQQAYIGQFNH